MDFDLTLAAKVNEGRICEKSIRAAWTRRSVFSKAVKRKRKSAMFLGRQTGSRAYSVSVRSKAFNVLHATLTAKLSATVKDA